MVRDFAMALRARKVSGAFEKRVRAHLKLNAFEQSVGLRHKLMSKEKSWYLLRENVDNI